jgi:hypothetical protein
MAIVWMADLRMSSRPIAVDLLSGSFLHCGFRIITAAVRNASAAW